MHAQPAGDAELDLDAPQLLARCLKQRFAIVGSQQAGNGLESKAELPQSEDALQSLELIVSIAAVSAVGSFAWLKEALALVMANGARAHTRGGGQLSDRPFSCFVVGHALSDRRPCRRGRFKVCGANSRREAPIQGRR
jgi:hypothetical protein